MAISFDDHFSVSTRVHDVIVVGGGPAGLYAALLLARQRWDVALIEEHRSFGDPVHCTGVLAIEAYPEFDIPRQAVLNPLSHAQFFAPSGAVVTYTTPDVEAVVIDRRRFDSELHSLAKSNGVTIVAPARVTDLKVGPQGVVASFADRADLRARSTILACGANYTLQRRLGLGTPPVFLRSAQAEWPSVAGQAVEVHFGRSVAPNGFAWVVPVQRGTQPFARIGLMCDHRAKQHFGAFVERIASRWGIAPGADGAPPEARLKMLPLAPIPRTYADRVLAVGDAAGLVKATTGGGIYYSLVSARLAAQILGEGLASNHLEASHLGRYQKAWRKRLGPELRAQLALRLLANRLTDAEIDELFELARTDGIMPIVRRTARFNQHRDLILSLLKHPPARRVLFRRFATWRQAAAL